MIPHLFKLSISKRLNEIFMDNNNGNNKGLMILAVILALFLLGLGWYAWSLTADKKELTSQNTALNTEMSELNMLKADLESEVDSLESAFADLAEENQLLEGSLADAEQEIKNQNVATRRARRDVKVAAEDNSGLRAQIEGLISAKSELQSQINSLQAENEALKLQNEELKGNLDNAQEENAALAAMNKTIQEEIGRLTLANFKAGAFRVEIKKGNTKATAKSRRARKLAVSFDLTNVPEKYQGVKTLYLVVTDDKGTPIKNSNPINAEVKVNGQAMNISAVKTKEVNIGQSQRLSFDQDLENKLRSGYYRVAVYTDIGLLGASSVRLR
ncbi:MAG: chromosome segregation ATPase [Paraglaciecola sp.]